MSGFGIRGSQGMEVDFTLSQLDLQSLDDPAGSMSGFLDILELPEECTGGAHSELEDLEPEPLPELQAYPGNLQSCRAETTSVDTSVAVSAASSDASPSLMGWTRAVGPSTEVVEQASNGQDRPTQPTRPECLSTAASPSGTTNTRGVKRRLVPSSAVGGCQKPTGERPVFLRERIGNESTSSCGSSCVSSDPESISEGELRAGVAVGGGIAARLAEGVVRSQKGVPVSGEHKLGLGVGVTVSGAGIECPFATQHEEGVECPRCHAVKSAVPVAKARWRRCHKSRRTRLGSRCSTPGPQPPPPRSNRKPPTYTWEELLRLHKRRTSQNSSNNSPTALDEDTTPGNAKASTVSPTAAPTRCTVFSVEPRPTDSIAFSVEQCSTSLHPSAIAVYVLRVRCGNQCHLVSRTWDDFTALCAMLRGGLMTDLEAGAGVGGGGGGDDRQGLTSPRLGVGGGGGVLRGGGYEATMRVDLEFAPARLLDPSAATGFFRNLLRNPGLVQALPVRRFLELEYVDGTFMGVSFVPMLVGEGLGGKALVGSGSGAGAGAGAGTGGPGPGAGLCIPFHPCAEKDLAVVWERLNGLMSGSGRAGGPGVGGLGAQSSGVGAAVPSATPELVTGGVGHAVGKVLTAYFNLLQEGEAGAEAVGKGGIAVDHGSVLPLGAGEFLGGAGFRPGGIDLSVGGRGGKVGPVVGGMELVAGGVGNLGMEAVTLPPHGFDNKSRSPLQLGC